jgi:hypothetical protein
MNSLTEFEEITLLSKFEDDNNSVGYVEYEGDDCETDWQKEHHDQLEKNDTIGWKILNLKTDKIEDITDWCNIYKIKNPYKALDRLAKLYKKLGDSMIPVDIETAYSNLITILLWKKDTNNITLEKRRAYKKGN